MSCAHIFAIVERHAITATGAVVSGLWVQNYDECVLCGAPKEP